MSHGRTLPILLVIASALAAATAQAQSTDARHSILVFPVVVDSASFVERLLFRNDSADTMHVNVRYYPAEGTTQAAALDCSTVFMSPNETKSYSSLRSLCPGLAGGSQFGFLYTWNAGAFGSSAPYSGYSRVENANGIGFSVEAFPAHAFTSGRSVVTGLRRLAATGGSPAYQTNCFIGVLNEVTPEPAPTQTAVSYTLVNNFGNAIGGGQVVLTPGKLVRLLDIFAAAGVQPGDNDDVSAIFDESGEGEPGVMSFCTVQDNASFGADFRIGKQAGGLSHGSLVDNPGAQDDGALRESVVDTDVALSSGPGTASARTFSIPAGATSNAHVLYFRHPDTVSCSIEDPATGFGLASAYGLEMRLMASDGVTVLAGGDDITYFSALYLGDKRDRDEGMNTRYVLEVESNETNTGANRPYRLHCRSGSGHGLGELVRTGGPNLF